MEPWILLVIIVGFFVALYLGYRIGLFVRDRHWKDQEPLIRQDAIKRSRAVLGGQFSEQLAPYLPDFPYKPTECRFLGKPIDIVVFRGMNEKEIEEVIFVEVKSGKASLSSVERKLRDVIRAKKVKWEEYRIPKGLTAREND